MKFWESVKMSLSSLRTNLMRSILTMLGIIIGVSAVISMVSIGQGASANVASQINGLGSNLLIVTSGQARQGNVQMGAGSLNTLTMEDADALAGQPSIAGVTPLTSRQGTVVWHNQSYATTIEGASESYPEVRSFSVRSGRFFTKFEVKGQANVAVIGPEVVRSLFGDANANPIGQTLQVNDMPMKIVGVLQAQGSQGMTNQDDRIIIPVTTAMNRLLSQKNIRTVYVSAKSADAMTQAQAEIEMTMRSQHHLKPNQDDDFQVNSQTQILSTAQGITSIMTALLSGIAAISLVVGGIGIMNIMLVSVTERTREIGIRKAVGATRRAILQQFLIESITLSVLGGLIGIGLGISLSLLLEKFASLAVSITMAPILYSFGTSILVGVIFGVYPAQKAAKLNPIDALRYE
ncbi:ABC transporter permease [Ectobacillus ponti]|uniref:ABC transporter permease n=1 Tax=Ectobacillus ponti TaxID=2961894 RepID=A0AA42BNM4_9BACI|nr:ABC transporter permease [Ectobacillus ponti]MCP8967556.1 ABC transporter permease [Ectobacillus ponti]